MSRHRSRHHDKERERSRSPQSRSTLRTQDDSHRESGREGRKREERRQRDDEGREEERRRNEGERRRGEDGERWERRWRDEGEKGDNRRKDEQQTMGRRLRDEEERREGRGRRGEREERRRREEGEGAGERDREESRKHGSEERNRHGASRDEDRKQKREQRATEDEEAKTYAFGGKRDKADDKDKKEEANFELSGKLTAETNTYKGVVIKYSEPAEGRQPTTRWRLYQFKGDEVLPTLYIHRQSAYLIGRDRRVVDLPIDHPSCSSQHAVLQYRLVPFEKKDGSMGKRVRPYLIDLESTNGTYINNQKIEPARYWELKEQDMIKFGYSSREYVLLHENSENSKDITEESGD